MFIGLFLFVPFSMIILAFRLLEKCWNDSLNRIVRLTRLFRIFRFMWIRLPLSGWIRDESIRFRELSVATASVVAMLNTTAVRRIRKNGVWILFFLAWSVFFAGLTLLLPGLLCYIILADGFLPVQLFVILYYAMMALCSFGSFCGCIYGVLFSLLTDEWNYSLVIMGHVVFLPVW